MPDSLALMKKLQLTAGMRLWLIDVPRGIAEALSAGAEIELVGPHDDHDGVLAFCRNPGEVESFAAQILPRLPPDGLLWFAYRKGAVAKDSGLGRDTGWSPLVAKGFTTVRSIAIDDEWTGLRFRHEALVKTRR
jgi:hypothetical protein